MNSHIRKYPHLYAPPTYKEATDAEIQQVVNGCGAAGAKFDFVPDSLLGLSIKECCHRHDWMYNEGRTIEDKDEADRAWRNNMLREIERGSWWLKRPRRFLARRYFNAVHYFGGPAYWANKPDGVNS